MRVCSSRHPGSDNVSCRVLGALGKWILCEELSRSSTGEARLRKIRTQVNEREATLAPLWFPVLSNAISVFHLASVN